jgi:hypothetical protein
MKSSTSRRKNIPIQFKQQLRNMANSYAMLVEGTKNTDESDILINRVFYITE